MEKETNKKTFVSVGKWGKALAIAGAVAGIVWYLKNSYKKELKNLSETKKEEDKKIESLGVSPERMRDQVYDCEREVDRNMVKAIYVGIESNPDWNEDVIDIDKVLPSQTIVHITEEKGRNNGLKYLNFLLEIPDNSVEKKGSFAVPRIGDYYIAMRQLKEHLWSREVAYCKEPAGRMTIYLAYSYRMPKKDEEGGYEVVTETVEIPRSIWSRWEDEHDGLIEFYEDVRENGMAAIKKKGILEEFQDVLTNDFVAKNPDANPSEFAIHYEDFILIYKISFKEARYDGDTGISVKTALDCLKYISEEFVVTRKATEKGGVKYDRFMFHAPSENGEFDSLTRYYTTDENNKVVFDSYAYPEEEPKKQVEYSPNSIKENVVMKSDKRLNKE